MLNGFHSNSDLFEYLYMHFLSESLSCAIGDVRTCMQGVVTS